jgi:GLPGLI family protein
MSLKITLLSLLCLNVSFAKQSFVYKVSADIDYDNIDETSVSSLMTSVEKQLDNQTFVLMLNKNKSHFKLKPNIDNESKNLQVTNIAKAMTSYLQLNTTFMNKPFSIEFDELPDWEIESDTKTIGNYKVIKATTHRKFIGSKGVKEKEIEAWFRPDIPISHGPMGAVGLPGLVIQLRLQNTIYTLEQIKDETIKIEEPKSDEALSSEQFYLVSDRKVDNFRESINN